METRCPDPFRLSGLSLRYDGPIPDWESRLVEGASPLAVRKGSARAQARFFSEMSVGACHALASIRRQKTVDEEKAKRAHRYLSGLRQEGLRWFNLASDAPG